MNRLLISLVCFMCAIQLLSAQCICNDAMNSCTGNVPADMNLDGCDFCPQLCSFLFSGAGVQTCLGTGLCSALPVKLTSFTAEILKESNQIKLQWSTASEANNKGFEIQRSINGQDWRSLYFIKGHGTTLTVQDYLFFDFPPVSGIYYYRLKQIDYDGNFEYSNILFFEYSIAIETTNIFPNPVKDILFIQTDYSQAIIYDRYGKPQKTMSINGQQSQIDLKDFKTGTYFIHFSGKNKKNLTRKILKL